MKNETRYMATINYNGEQVRMMFAPRHIEVIDGVMHFVAGSKRFKMTDVKEL